MSGPGFRARAPDGRAIREAWCLSEGEGQESTGDNVGERMQQASAARMVAKVQFYAVTQCYEGRHSATQAHKWETLLGPASPPTCLVCIQLNGDHGRRGKMVVQ